jgi:DNA-binding transcriptional regulator GbsR (MarR family)
MEDNTIDINGDIKLKLPTNKILSEELKMSESTLSDKLKLMETQGVLVIKSWGGGNKRGRYVES